MQRSSDGQVNAAWHGIAVAILTEDQEQQLAILKHLEAIRVARIVFSHLGFPVSSTDPSIREIQDLHAEIVVVDLPTENLQRALHAIELIQDTTNDIAFFVIGETSKPTNIVAAMRAGASEYLDRHCSDQDLLEAFTRFSTARTKRRGHTRKARCSHRAY